jgi:hypothetical protein
VEKKMMKTIFLRYFVITSVLFFLLSDYASAAVKISSTPQPPLTAKLRIFVVTVTTESDLGRRPIRWTIPNEKIQEWFSKEINKMLQDQGIYEVNQDIRKVIGNQTISGSEWTADNMELLKKVGKALYSDYALLFERSFKGHLQFDMSLLNLSSGKLFSISNYIPTSTLLPLSDYDRLRIAVETVKITYGQLFSEAKADLLQTAMNKELPAAKNLKPLEPASALPTATQEKPADSSQEIATVEEDYETETQASNVRPPDTGLSAPRRKQAAFESKLDTALSRKDKQIEAPCLVVYDLNTGERLKVIGLILTEALREALQDSGKIILVNRDNLLKFMEENKLQQSNLMDEAQAIKIGKKLSTNEVVMGTLSTQGGTSFLQVKRIDLSSQKVISTGALKCPAGHESDLLNKIPNLSRRLLQSSKQ